MVICWNMCLLIGALQKHEKVPLIAVHLQCRVCMSGLQYTFIGTLLFITQDQRTALHYASEGGHHDTVRVLLERGTDPNTRDGVSGV